CSLSLLIRSPIGDPDVEPIGRLSGGLELGEVDPSGGRCFADRPHVETGAALHCGPGESHAVALDAPHVVVGEPVVDVWLGGTVGEECGFGLVLKTLRRAREFGDLDDELRARFDTLDRYSGADIAAGATEWTALAFATASNPAFGR